MALSPSTTTKREFSHIRLLILLTTVLNTLDLKSKPNLITQNFQDDLHYCRQCFQSQSEPCHKFLADISNDSEEFSISQLLTVLPTTLTSCKRTSQVLTRNSTHDKIMAKYLASTKEHLTWLPNTEQLQRFHQANERLNGLQYFPKENIKEFIALVHSHHKTLSETTLWLYLLVNSQPLLMPLLHQQGFPVPKTYAICGFTLYQAHAGLDLHHFQHYHGKNFIIKLIIAQQLLEAAVKFSHGFESYRLYITDLTADNMMFDIKRQLLTFIDLDTLLIVNARHAKYKTSIHRHDYIECPGCFAYSPSDIGAHNVSDINIYSACQFLREDLYGDESKGFLHPLPQELKEKYPSFMELLSHCVDCPPAVCRNRFAVANDFLDLIGDIIEDFNVE